MCLDILGTRDLFPPQENILLLGRRCPFCLSPSAIITCGHGLGEDIWICLDFDHPTAVTMTKSPFVNLMTQESVALPGSDGI
jgi:hypothetical protein